MLRLYFQCVLVVLILTGAGQTASATPAPQSGSESLGNQLLDDLRPIKPPKSTAEPADPQHVPKGDGSWPSRAPRFDDLGEDIGQAGGPLSLVRVRQGMERAESLLGETPAPRQSDALHEATAVQKRVVDQLDQLIAELSKQCQGGQCPPGEAQPAPDQQAQAKPANSQSAAAKGQAAARDSTTQLENSVAKPVEKADIEDLVKQLWGHLPPRTRDQMMQSFSEDFLPKYEPEIEAYYRRLSEERGVPRAQEKAE